MFDARIDKLDRFRFTCKFLGSLKTLLAPLTPPSAAIGWRELLFGPPPPLLTPPLESDRPRLSASPLLLLASSWALSTAAASDVGGVWPRLRLGRLAAMPFVPLPPAIRRSRSMWPVGGVNCWRRISSSRSSSLRDRTYHKKNLLLKVLVKKFGPTWF